MSREWWKSKVCYQIYMPSFCDGNGDGIGDFKGIRSKLAYLKDLGIGCVWLTPFYKSPKVDNGYDISDYYAIDPDYGSMEEFEQFIEEAHQLGIRVIADIVINHTSSEHPWFREARASKDSSKRDWYIWKDPVDGKEPNNWESFFGQKAWEYDELSQQYYYHKFAKEQVDLNWSNKELKKEIFKMLDFWLQKGIDGFRLDVINFLTVNNKFTDNPYDESGKQQHIYDINQEGIYEVMNELREFIDQYEDKFLVGEIGSDKLEEIYSYVGEDKLHTTFNFNLGSQPVFEVDKFYKEIEKMHKLYQEHLPTLFFGSHDMARFPSRFNLSDEGVKVIATFMLSYSGIPFIYFGDEIGMRNLEYKNRKMARDIQGIIAYDKSIARGESVEQAIEEMSKEGRDYSRSVMQWSGEKYAGFSEECTWIDTTDDYIERNVEEQKRDPHSILSYYKDIISLREERLALSVGKCTDIRIKDEVIYYVKQQEQERLLIVLNFSNREMAIQDIEWVPVELLLSSNASNNLEKVLPCSAAIYTMARSIEETI